MKVTTHGFFRPCRITGRRTWFVVTIPGHDGDITGIGPADDDHWDPTTETDDDLLRMPALQARDHVSPSDASGPTYGSRSVGETMRVLRQMLGCPLSA